MRPEPFVEAARVARLVEGGPFAEFLLATPKAERTGRVFEPKRRKWSGPALVPRGVSETCSLIGKAAGVVVSTAPKSGKIKHASCHDLRRSFGERWSQRVMPAVLQQLMRHENVETTMRFYVGRNAEATADAVWEAYEGIGNTTGNTPQESPVFQLVSLD